jgi:secreted trypsin-like serine protease
LLRIIFNNFLFLFLFLNLLESGTLDTRIINGTKVTNLEFNKFNFVVTIGESNNGYFSSKCTGVLIAEDLVLTAAHCLLNTSMSIYANINVLKYSDEAILSKVTQIFYPRDFQLIEYDNALQSIRNDIAILKIDKKIKLSLYPSIANKTIFQEALKLDITFDIAGWGLIEDNKISHNLMQTSLHIADSKICTKIMNSFNINRSSDFVVDLDKEREDYKNNVFCAGGVYLEKTRKGSCSGDSGASILYRKDEEVYILGVLSNGGIPCGDIPDFYTNVSEYEDFINDVKNNANKVQDVKKDILRIGYINSLSNGYHLLGTEHNLDYTSDIFKNIKEIYIQDKDIVKKILIVNGRLPKGIIIYAKSGFWVNK